MAQRMNNVTVRGDVSPSTLYMNIKTVPFISLSVSWISWGKIMTNV